MDTVILIILIIVASISLIVSIVTLVLLFKKNGSPINNHLEEKLLQENASLKANIESLEKTIPLQVQNAIEASSSKQAIFLKDNMQKQAEADVTRLNNFQASINQRLDSAITSLNDKVDKNLSAINTKVDESLSKGFKATADSMANLQKELGIVQQAQKNLDNLQSEISSLTGVLTNGQQRGRYGEWQLELLLQAMFGETKGTLFDTQKEIWKSKDGSKRIIPDAIIYLDGKRKTQILAIDSKFSLTGFEAIFESKSVNNQEVDKKLYSDFENATKKRIEETSKYILPGVTINMAVMFIPSDGVFAFIQQEFPKVVELARNKHVMLASPSILQPLLYSFRILQIDADKRENLEHINKAIDALADDFRRFIPRWSKLQKDINMLSKSSGEFDITVNKLGSKFEKIKESDVAPEVEKIDEDNLTLEEEKEGEVSLLDFSD